MHEYMTTYCEKCNKFSHCNNNELICISRYRAKEQECEEINLTNEKLVAEKYALNEEILKLKQALDEIEELAKQNNFLVRDPFCGTGYRDLSGQILGIVNEAKENK